MELALLALALVLLLGLNAFFVMAEFAIVKLRPSRVQELAQHGERRAALLVGIQGQLDEYLSVCQVGITLASVALGMTGERLAAVLLGGSGGGLARYLVAIAISYVLISGSHIVLGELVPKSVAIRVADRAALFSAAPMRFFYFLFFPILWILTRLANGILVLIGIPPSRGEEQHSEEELRILLGESQERGLMSFRRLLFMENVFDFGGLTVRDAMRPRAKVRTMHTRHPWPRNLDVLRDARYSRYPLLMGDLDAPVGFIHVKDLVLRTGCDEPDLTELARPILRTTADTPLETLLAEMQRKRIHVAVVFDGDDRWTGLVTLEDIQEELVGTIRDEFEDEEPVRLADALSRDRILLDVEADSPLRAIELALARIDTAALHLPRERLLEAIQRRGRTTGAEVIDGFVMVQARVRGLGKPLVLVLRSPGGIPCEGARHPARLIITLLSPGGEPRVHHRLRTVLATVLQESEYVRDRLLTADSPAEVADALTAGEQAAMD